MDNHATSHQQPATHFSGLDGMVWFTGVVEDRMDPKKLGRVRVRIWGTHCKSKVPNDQTGQGIPTDELPWSWVMRPVTSAAMDGIGDSPLGLVEGTWVVGISRDGQLMNDTIIIGCVGGIPEDPPQDKQGKLGFVDPRTAGKIDASPRWVNPVHFLDPGYPPIKIPMGRYPQEKFLNEPDTNRLARAEELDQTINKVKEDNRKRGIPVAMGGEWDEKASAYAAQYPYNHVRETECGHVVEFDDTPHKERIHLWHNGKFNGGSYIEIDHEGNVQVRFQKDHYEISLGDRKVYAKGDVDVTSDGNVNILSTGGHINIQDKGSGVTVDSVGPITAKTDSFCTVEAALAVTVQAGAEVTVRAGGLVTVEAAVGVTVQALGPVNIESAIAVNLIAPLVTANGQPIATT